MFLSDHKTPLARGEHLLLSAVLMIMAWLFVHYDLLWRVDNLLYDTHLSIWTRDVPEDIIIIAIDDESLNKLGRWPWPRSTHATLINKLDEESPKVIGLDIIFNEPDYDHPLADVLLARAMRKAGNVVLPVFMTQQSSNSFPIEALPLPEFTHNTAALGHVHIDTSADGIARKVYLREGIGKPQWPHYSVAMLEVAGESHQLIKQHAASPEDTEYSVMQWARESPLLIPYAGPTGHFNQIGYWQVMSGNYPANLFKDKLVLVGATAEGLGDILPTPLAGKSGSMPGVEVIAHIMDALRNNHQINRLDKTAQLIVTLLLVAIPVLLYPYLTPASTLLVLAGVMSLTLAVIALLLIAFGIWIPVATILLIQLISYPLWSWRRLDRAMCHINAELNSLTSMQRSLSIHRERNLDEELQFMSRLIPIKGWVLKDHHGNNILEHGSVPQMHTSQFKEQGWIQEGYRMWANTWYNNQHSTLGISLGVDAVITNDELNLLNTLLDHQHKDDTNRAYLADVLESKIDQVHHAGKEYEELRKIVDDSLSGMADGVLICSGRGQIMLSNQRAGWYLQGDDNAKLNGQALIDVLSEVRLNDGETWRKLFERVLFRQERITRQGVHNDGRDLLIEISPLRIISDAFDGFIINLSDISLLMESEHRRNQVLNFISHDLRSPLASMLAMIELAKSKQAMDEIQVMLDNMEVNTNKTLQLAEQFLQLSRANTSEHISFYDTDFNTIVLNAIDQLWALSNKHSVSIKHHFEEEELWIHAEPDLLERAVVNLLSNAVKHSDVDSTVSIDVIIDNNEISCCVTDTGCGIPADELPSLFDMFKRTHDDRVEKRKPGIGLGLAFVDAVAKRHGGQVDVVSQVGEGSTFCIRFPIVEAVEALE